MIKFVLGYLIGGLFVLVGFAAFQPDCPTEDSCRADYSNGEWKIEEIKP